MPVGQNEFELPPIDLVPALEVTGKLVDKNYRPLTNWTVYGYPAEGQMNSFAGVATSDDGSFRGSVPSTVPPKVWKVSFRDWSDEYDFEDKKYDAKIKKEEPLVIQVDVDGRSLEEKKSTAVNPPRTEFTLVIAKNMMLLDGREFITWAELEDRIAKLKDASKTRLNYYVSGGARDAGLDELRAAEHKRFAEKFGFVGYSIGSLSPRSSIRYDALELPDDLTPNPDHAVSLSIANSEGSPVGGAQVILIEPGARVNLLQDLLDGDGRWPRTQPVRACDEYDQP